MRLIDRGRVMIAYLANLGMKDSYKAKCEALFKAIDEAPVVDAEPVRHGRWIDRGDYVTTAYGSLDLKICSACNAEVTLDDYDYYCPNCGAKMDADVQDD